jgi:hypothetical protein
MNDVRVLVNAVTGDLKSIQGLVRLRDAPNTASFYHSVMGEKTTEPGRPKWWLPRCAAIIEILIFIPIAISHPDTVFSLGIFLILPILFVASIVLVVLFCRSAFGSGRFRPLPLLTTLAIIWLIPTGLVLYERAHPFALHETARWLGRSREYKDKVLAQPASNGELRHIEWDGSGFAGIANQTVYLVFDPSDSLSAGGEGRGRNKFNGVPCEVPPVQRLESHWYSVVFYTDQDWSHCN